jgi:hypothetical protein
MIWSHLFTKVRFGSTHYVMKNLVQSKFYISLITEDPIYFQFCSLSELYLLQLVCTFLMHFVLEHFRDPRVHFGDPRVNF